MNKKVQITTDYITLGQLLKFENVIANGSEAKAFVLNHQIIVNGEASNQRGKKLYPSTVIVIDDSWFFEIIK